MAARIVAKIATVFLLLQVFLIATQATELILERGTQEGFVANGTQDFIWQKQLEYNASISSYDQQMEQFSAVYRAKVAVIEVKSRMIQNELDDAENNLNALELLSPLRNHCVQKYRSRLFGKSSVKTILDACITNANNALPSLLSQPTSTMSTLKKYHDLTLPYNLNDCYRSFLSTNPKYTACILENMKDADTYTRENQKIFAANLQEASCTGAARIKVALDCSSDQMSGAIGSIHETMLLIDMCVENAGATCDGTSKSLGCGKSIDLPMSPADFRSASIKNLFYGMSSTSGCVQVNFVTM